MMKKTLIAIGSGILAIVGVLASLASDGEVFAHQVYAQAFPIVTCDSGANLSYDQAVVSIANGGLVIDRNPDLTLNQVTVTVTNNTPCSVSVSLGSYKMFGPYSLATQSLQEFFDGSLTVNVAPASSETLSVNLPECAAQYDFWYGDVPHVLIDNHPYGEVLYGDQLRPNQLCEHPVAIVVPVVPAVPVAPVIPEVPIVTVPQGPVYLGGGGLGGGGSGPIIPLTVISSAPIPRLPPTYIETLVFPNTGFAPEEKVRRGK